MERSSPTGRAGALARHADNEAQRLAEHLRSKRTLKEIEAMMVEREDINIDMLHPEKCKWLERILKQILEGDREMRYFAVCRFKAVFNGMLASRNSSACTTYASYVLNQTVILEELSRGCESTGRMGSVIFSLKSRRGLTKPGDRGEKR